MHFNWMNPDFHYWQTRHFLLFRDIYDWSLTCSQNLFHKILNCCLLSIHTVIQLTLIQMAHSEWCEFIYDCGWRRNEIFTLWEGWHGRTCIQRTMSATASDIVLFKFLSITAIFRLRISKRRCLPDERSGSYLAIVLDRRTLVLRINAGIKMT